MKKVTDYVKYSTTFLFCQIKNAAERRGLCGLIRRRGRHPLHPRSGDAKSNFKGCHRLQFFLLTDLLPG